MLKCPSAFVLLLAAAVPLAAQSPCDGHPACADTSSFTANVLDFRTSTAGYDSIVTVTVRFRNKLNRPLILGYVKDSGVAIDDQGNRFGIYADTAVRGIGIVSGNVVDPKFVLGPGASSDGRFELAWRIDRRKIYGLTFQLDLTIREIHPVSASQFRLGQEHAIHFANLSNAGLTRQGSPAPVQAASVPPAAAAPARASDPQAAAPPADHCAGLQRCYDAGAFTAEIAQVTSARQGTYNDHLLRINVRFRNVSAEPIVLAYQAKSSVIIDNLGNRYYWGRAGTYDTSVTGMGISQGRQANAEFVLQPGQARNATFQLIRYNVRNAPVGAAYNFDFVIEQLEVLPSQQIRVAREHSISYQAIGANSMGGGTAQSAESLSEATKAIRDIFKKK